MAFAETSTTEQGKQPYKFGGKELDQMHGLNFYDVSARYVNGINFTTIDPMAEKYYSWSPYVYCTNNPLRLIDPTGMYNEEGSSKRKSDKLEKNSFQRMIDSKNAAAEKARLTDGILTIGSNTDRYTFIGGDMTYKKNYVYRDNIDDGKNDIEVSLPTYYVEAAAPKMQRWDGVAIGFEINFDVQVGAGLAMVPASGVFILAGPDKGKAFYLAGGNFISGPIAYSLTGNITFYSYTGMNIRNFSIRDIEGDMEVFNVSVELGGVLSYTVLNSKDTFSGGSVQGISLGIGRGISKTILGGYYGTVTTGRGH